MKFIKLSLCLMLAGSFSGAYASEDSSQLLPAVEAINTMLSQSHCSLLSQNHSRDYDLTTSQGKYDFLKKKSLVEYKSFLHYARQNENVHSQIECMEDAGLYLSASLVLAKQLTEEDVTMLFREYAVEAKVMRYLLFCCNCNPGHGPITRYLDNLEDKATRAVRSLRDSISIEERP